jgi:hypothetical protein
MSPAEPLDRPALPLAPPALPLARPALPLAPPAPPAVLLFLPATGESRPTSVAILWAVLALGLALAVTLLRLAA